ncbi:MAG: glycosyltransferase family 4 protein [Pseudomonadota bacterium]
MKLLHAFSTFAIGGSQARFAQLVDRLGNGYHHHVTAMDADVAGFPALEIVTCPERLTPFTLPVQKTGSISLDNVRQFSRTLQDQNVDGLCTYNFGSIEWSIANRFINKKPHLHFEDGFGSDESLTKQLRRRVFGRRLAIGSKTTIVVPSKGLEGLARDRWGFKDQQIRRIPNGVDVQRFYSPPGGRSFRTHPDEIIVGTIGALRPEKNYGRLLRAFQKASADLPLRLIVVGDGAERSALEALASTLEIDDRIVFCGSVSDAQNYYCGFDIFALSSDTEQLPMTVLEAMAAGKPVLSTDVGDIQDTVSEENHRFISPLDDETALVHGMKVLAASSSLREHIGSQNASRAQSVFSIDTMMDRYSDLLAETVPESTNASGS